MSFWSRKLKSFLPRKWGEIWLSFRFSLQPTTVKILISCPPIEIRFRFEKKPEWIIHNSDDYTFLQNSTDRIAGLASCWQVERWTIYNSSLLFFLFNSQASTKCLGTVNNRASTANYQVSKCWKSGHKKWCEVLQANKNTHRIWKMLLPHCHSNNIERCLAS